MKTNEEPIIVIEEFSCSLSELWEAITEPELMKQWFFKEIEEFSPELGFNTQFDVNTGKRVFRHIWKVVKVEPYKEICLSWRYEGFKGDSVLCFQIKDIRGSSEIKVNHSVKEDFEEDIEEFSRESCLGGWQYFINDRLKNFLDKS